MYAHSGGCPLIHTRGRYRQSEESKESSVKTTLGLNAGTFDTRQKDEQGALNPQGASLACRNGFSTAALLFLVMLAQACVS